MEASREPRIRVPVDDAYRDWRTVQFERTVLVIARTVTTLTRLLDILELTKLDRRIQTVFTHDPANAAIFSAGVQRFLDRIEGAVLPWDQATETRFDLAIAASENDRLQELDTPILLVPHGVGYQKYYPNSRVISGLNPERLLDGDRVVPAAIALPHARQHEQLRAVCPAAAPRAVVVGDPSLDRMLASRHREVQYRAGFGAGDKKLVILASTWGSSSLLGGWPELPDRLVAELPVDEYQIAVVLHPGIWSGHGPWQVHGWLSRAEAYGLRVVPPEDGWQAALTAATCVLSDQGSLSLYAAALDKPLLLAPGDSPNTVADSALAALTTHSARLDPSSHLRTQIDAAIHGHVPGANDTILGLAFDDPGRCAQRLRPLIYRLLGLAEPTDEPSFAPVSAPVLRSGPVPALIVGAEVSAGTIALTRHPDLRTGRPHDQLDYRHLAVNVDQATVGQLSGATILCVSSDSLVGAEALLGQWPKAMMVATALDPYICRIQTRDFVATLSTSDPVWRGADPLLLASLAYVRLRSSGKLPPQDQLRIGDRVIEVAAATGPASPGTR
jgi:hypothetical protein